MLICANFENFNFLFFLFNLIERRWMKEDEFGMKKSTARGMSDLITNFYSGMSKKLQRREN